jgi:hypothetical protein
VPSPPTELLPKSHSSGQADGQNEPSGGGGNKQGAPVAPGLVTADMQPAWFNNPGGPVDGEDHEVAVGDGYLDLR